MVSLKQIPDVKAKFKELTDEHEAYEKQKKDYEIRFAGMKQAVDMAIGTKTDVKEVQATQDAVKAKKAEAEKAAAAGDYAAGITRLNELDAALKAHEEELRKTPRECDWVNAVAIKLSALIDIKYLQANTKILGAAQAYDDALKEHSNALKQVAAAKELAASVAVGIFFAGLGGAVGSAVSGATRKSLEAAFEKRT